MEISTRPQDRLHMEHDTIIGYNTGNDTNSNRNSSISLPDSSQPSIDKGKQIKYIPRGLPISGNPWKEVLGLNKRASANNAVKTLHTSWEYKAAQREKTKRLKESLRDLKEKYDLRKAKELERIKQARARREVNSLKNVQYDIVKDTGKLKKVSKNQWQNYRKLADINKW